MSIAVEDFILEVTGASSVFQLQVIQRLWRGYGHIVRYGITDCEFGSVIVKHIQLPHCRSQTSNIENDLSHRRKVHSYHVETVWYKDWSRHCDTLCRVPRCLASTVLNDEVLIILEDLDAAGFSQRRSRVNDEEMQACLSWLAHFHATFINQAPTGLWPIGTYWHLDTRPDELRALDDIPLKNAAAAIDQKLRASPFQTLVHGDAKLANFCFSKQGGRVAAVDFQYVGGGCGIKDVAYFIDSCLEGEQCQRQERHLLHVYFQALKLALQGKRKTVDADAIEQDWRALYPVAWTDFHRFMKGWSPAHWSIDSYSERLAREVLSQLK
jgi:hypothetical protein